MLILALETSSLAGSVALMDDDNLLSERLLPSDRRSAQTLAPAIDELLKAAGRRAVEVQLVAVTVGPGSFTGLRVGVTTAKTFAYAIDCEAMGLDTLEVIAAQIVLPTMDGTEIQAVLDAQRKELYLARFRSTDDELTRIDENRIVSADAWLATLSPGTVVTGGGLNRLEARLPDGVVAVSAELREPRASTVGRLAIREYQRGRRDDLWKLAPHYLRPSAAEEKVGQVSNLPRKKEGRQDGAP